MTSFTLVTTTIHEPKVLKAYIDDARRFGRPLDVIVIGDEKTPAIHGFCKELGIDYYDVERQKEYLKDFPALAACLPWNSISRRNVGMLLAYEGESDIVVTIDDDNFPVQPDYFGHHAHVGTASTLRTIHSASGWFNITGPYIYPRGYPLSQRWTRDEQFFASTNLCSRVAVNAGLWLDDPDIDAIQRLVRQPTGMLTDPEPFAIDLGTWAPFNSQNTAMSREVIPAYFLSPNVGRYDDIWASYIVRHIADHLGHVVSYGPPFVRQQRNAHNVLDDLDRERMGMERTEAFIEAVKATKLTGKTYGECFREVARQLSPFWTRLRLNVWAGTIQTVDERVAC